MASGAEELLEWAVAGVPGADAQATVTRAAAGAGVRHVCTSILAVYLGNFAGAPAPTNPNRYVQLRDGASGVGTILWQSALSVQAVSGAVNKIELSGLRIVGSAATAMTLEFSGAGGPNTQ